MKLESSFNYRQTSLLAAKKQTSAHELHSIFLIFNFLPLNLP